jgi:ABC-type sugar transport system ATPase subunit
MREGRIHQIGTPWEIYKRPATLFVAGFVGAMNLLDPVPLDMARRIAARHGQRPRTVGIRPEDVALETGDDPGEGIPIDGTVSKISFAGREALYFVATEDGATLQVQVHRPTAALLERVGRPVRLRLTEAHLLPYDESGRLIADGSP